MPPSTPLRIATRRSPLALWQAEFIQSELEKRGRPCELVPIVSEGDVDMRPFTEAPASGQPRTIGVFTKSIQDAVLNHQADIAVHSLKDLPTESHPELIVAAIPPRAAVHDLLVTLPNGNIDHWEDLPHGSRIGTGSVRRSAQLLARRPDFEVVPIRGNVQTRIGKLSLPKDDGGVDAIVLAAAGIRRLELEQEIHCVPFSTEDMLPAPGQGALAVECLRSASQDESLFGLDHWETRMEVVAERALLSALGGGCLAPIGALGKFVEDSLVLEATVLSADGSASLRQRDQIDFVKNQEISENSQNKEAATPLDVSIQLATDLGRQLAESLRSQGADQLLRP